MIPPRSEDPALAALPPGGDLYFEPAANLQTPAQQYFGGGRSAPTGAQSVDATAPVLYFGTPQNYTDKGEPIVQASQSSRGHVSEILNFHGSPAPWVLIGILLVAGILHLQAEGKFGFGGRV